MPDVFVPLDSTRFSDYFVDLIRKGVLNNFTMNYLDKNRKKLLNEYPDFESFKATFEVDEKLFAEFVDMAEESGVLRKEDDKYHYPESDLKVQIKAMIARNLWDINAYFRVINVLDNELEVALKLIHEGRIFSELGLN